MLPEEELEALVPPWELSEAAWELLRKTDPGGWHAAQNLLEAYNRERERSDAKKEAE